MIRYKFSLLGLLFHPSPVIPTKKASYYAEDITNEQANKANTHFGARSMGVADRDLETTHNIQITRNGVEVNKSEFSFEVATQQIPTGLWGDAKVKMSGGKERLLPPETNEQQFLDNTLSGFRIVTGKPPAPGNTQSIEVTKLQYDIEPTENPYAWKNIPAFLAKSAPDESRRTTIKNSIASTSTNQRNQLLQSLGFLPNQDVQLTNSVADAFVIAPQVKS